ncbi:MAG: spore coat protein [Ruminococcaceae bacterium]|nr:spore coat protein [Oscillospiraceae bacterium]
MHYVAMIQARCGSSRLPGKILKDLCGKPVLQHVIERVQKSKHMTEVVVVTSIDPQNLPVMKLCADMGVRVFAGAENDVLDRFYQMAKLIRPDYVVRITADCPCFDWTLLDRAVEAMEPGVDYLSDFGETMPDGLDLEIMTFQALEKAWKEADMASEREHVTQYIRKHPEYFNLKDLPGPVEGIGHLRWTLDEAEDYELIQKIYEHFTAVGKADFLLGDILDFLRENPELCEINAKFARNEGLAKSLREDKIVEHNN